MRGYHREWKCVIWAGFGRENQSAATAIRRNEDVGMGVCSVARGTVFLVAMFCLCLCAARGAALPAVTAEVAHGSSGQTPATARPVGTIKALSGNTITLTTDTGNDVTIVVQEAAKLARIAPGQKDLKDAVAIQLQELLPGDRILVRGQLADDGKTVLATSVIAMKKADIVEKQAREREEWQRRGTAGLVSSVDAASNTITVSLPGIGEKKTVTVRFSKDTILRRYAPDSVKF